MDFILVPDENKDVFIELRLHFMRDIQLGIRKSVYFIDIEISMLCIYVQCT